MTPIAKGSPEGVFCGLLFDLPSSNTEKVRKIIDEWENKITECDHCGEKAVRVGAFEAHIRDKDAVDIRGLCERHKQFGMW